ncbi:gamma-glutamyl cyclotransferase [Caudoviricetes sp.]|nr:gamma-glutamyl cyclotransferase [Caudoviricetes sp.]
MCVIIIKQKKNHVVTRQTLERAGTINPDGLGIVWLDDYSISYHKSKDWAVLDTPRPYIAHFRYATKGKVGRSNTHPFQCGEVKHEFLMHNGTIAGLGTHEVCDSRMLAEAIGKTPRHTWEQALAEYESRFVTINTHKRSFQIYNKQLWSKKDGVWYSKDNVLLDNYVAVYGTLKVGNSNYYSYLSDKDDAHYVGGGTTKDMYPLIAEGLPYLGSTKGIGHNVEVDVFAVNSATMKRLDSLEGHPNWYCRKEIPIMVEGKEVMCWIYFNDTVDYTNKEYLKTYEQKYKSYSGGYSGYSGYGGYGGGYNNYGFSSRGGYQPRNHNWNMPQPKTQPKTKGLPKQVDIWEDWDYDTEGYLIQNKKAHQDRKYCMYCYREVTEFSDHYNSHYCGSCGTFLYKDEVISSII